MVTVTAPVVAVVLAVSVRRWWRLPGLDERRVTPWVSRSRQNYIPLKPFCGVTVMCSCVRLLCNGQAAGRGREW